VKKSPDYFDLKTGVGDIDRKIVVGIDFGVRFSRVAWAESRNVSAILLGEKAW